MIDFRVKETFFDRSAIQRAVGDAARKVLSKFGAYVRQAARSSIRKRKAVSKPGQPPSSHVGTLKRLLFFGYDPAKKSVVIGPTPLGSGSADAPPLLEYGGQARVKGRKGKSVTATYRPRPFMGPALEKEEPKLPQMWADSVSK